MVVTPDTQTALDILRVWPDDFKWYLIPIFAFVVYIYFAEIEKGKTGVDWRELTDIRPFIDRYLELTSDQNVTEQITKILPTGKHLKDAILRLILEYPRDWESLIDEAALREQTSEAFEFHLIKRPQMETRVRIPEGKVVGGMPPEELLEMYWDSAHTDAADQDTLMNLAKDIIYRSKEE